MPDRLTGRSICHTGFTGLNRTRRTLSPASATSHLQDPHLAYTTPPTFSRDNIRPDVTAGSVSPIIFLQNMRSMQPLRKGHAGFHIGCRKLPSLPSMTSRQRSNNRRPGRGCHRMPRSGDGWYGGWKLGLTS